MVDQPEILFSPDSEVKGMKPDDLKALSEALRDTLSGQHWPRAAIRWPRSPVPACSTCGSRSPTWWSKKKKRGLLAYTPVGAVVKGARD